MFTKEDAKLTVLKACVASIDSMLGDYRMATTEFMDTVLYPTSGAIHSYELECRTYRLNTVVEDLGNITTTLNRLAYAYLRTLESK